jgi:hypothetical protein
MRESDFLNYALLGDQDAVAFVQMLGRISQTWDAIVDGDEYTADDVHQAFMFALFSLHTNSFYLQYKETLAPLMRAAAHDWIDSTELERSGESAALPLAFVLRDSLVSLVVQCAYLIGGTRHAIEIGPEIRRYFHDESLADYLKGVA